MASNSSPGGARASAARSLRLPRERAHKAAVLPSLLLSEKLGLGTSVPDADEGSADADAGRTSKRKRQLLSAMLGALDAVDDRKASVSPDLLSTDMRAAADSAADSASRSASRSGHESVPAAGDTLVVSKKCDREASDSCESPGLRCWSAEGCVGTREEALRLPPPPLRRSASMLAMFTGGHKRPSLERRQLSAAAVDAASLAVRELALPTVQSKDHPDLNVISPETVRRVLAGEFSDRLVSFELIDCRFAYEHRGGSLRGSRSLADPSSVEEAFMARPAPNCTRVALIFFCEFSANRAPKMARHMRNLDRWIHADRYPELFYPEMYLIDGGYKNCFEQFKDEICDPPAYVRMNDDRFTDACRVEFSAWRRQWKAHKMASCAKQFQRASEPPAATASTAIPKLRARPVQSLVDQL